MFQKLKDKISHLILAGLLVAALFVWQAVLAEQAGENIKVIFFDVGQGSATLIDASNGNQVLIDGGPSDAILSKLGETLPYSDRRLELVILTHPDADHLNGLIEILKRYEVEKILETGIFDNSANYQVWQKIIKEKDIPVVFAQADQTIKVADNLVIKILHPFGLINGQDFKERTNDSSIVAKLFYGQNTLLLTGDAEIKVEDQLIFAGADLKSDILQVGHHGSKGSTGEEFLAAVAPQIAVIQAGLNNRYGHPHQETLGRLKNIETWRTDLDKDVKFICNLKKCEKR